MSANSQELYTQPYSSIRWAAQQTNVNPIDIYCPHSRVLDAVHAVAHIYEHLPRLPILSSLVPLRQRALERAYQLIIYEDENTGYQTIGPVSKAFNMVARFAWDGRDSESFRQHRIKVENFLWMGREGLMMTGTDGSQLWDLTFISQAMRETGLAMEDEHRESAGRMLEWLDKAQIRQNPKWWKERYRHRTKGAWGFSTQEQGYTVSDGCGGGLNVRVGTDPGVGERLRGRGTQGCARAAIAAVHARAGRQGAPAGLYRYDSVDAESQRRLCEL